MSCASRRDTTMTPQSTCLIVHWPDGRRHTERFSTLADFRDRVVELQHTMEVEGWLSSGSPQILRDGWRIA